MRSLVWGWTIIKVDIGKVSAVAGVGKRLPGLVRASRVHEGCCTFGNVIVRLSAYRCHEAAGNA